MNEPIGEHAAKLERDAIVAWLRGVTADRSKMTAKELNSRGFTELIAVTNVLADACERGDHHD